MSFAYAGGTKFPALTGRVVDNAHLLSASTVEKFTAESQAQEDKTGEQVVVVTLPSLQGQTIEDYGYQLGRHWGIGQKGKDNGVLLIVAPNERKVRIEVGYGLEGTLTDAICSQIVYNIILPDFRAGQMEVGINEGLNAILTTLDGHPPSFAPSAQAPIQGPVGIGFVIVFVFALLILLCFPTGNHTAAFLLVGNSWGSSLGGGSFGGFSGGGGSFGGGGCSGGW